MTELLDSIRHELLLNDRRHSAVLLFIAALVLALPLLLFGGAVADVAISIAALAFLYWSWSNGDFTWARQTWVMIGLALWVYLVIRGVTSIDPNRSGSGAIVWIRFVIFAAAAQFILMHSRRALLLSICAMSVFGAADALLQYFYGMTFLADPSLHQRFRMELAVRYRGIGSRDPWMCRRSAGSSFT